MQNYQDVDSFKFADVSKHWARERLVHEVVVARELAKGVIRDGLRMQSVDPQWLDAQAPLRGEPLVGYSAKPQMVPVIVRADALQHLLAVERKGVEPDFSLLTEEQVTRGDFRLWLILTGRAMPAFWFGVDERASA